MSNVINQRYWQVNRAGCRLTIDLSTRPPGWENLQLSEEQQARAATKLIEELLLREGISSIVSASTINISQLQAIADISRVKTAELQGRKYVEGVLIPTAAVEAKKLCHEYIGTEHLLLGLIKTESIARLLQLKGIDPTTIESEIYKVVQTGPDDLFLSKPPLTPRARKALELSKQEAEQMGSEHIRPEHVFLGLIREEEGLAGSILLNHGFDLDSTRKNVLLRDIKYCASA